MTKTYIVAGATSGIGPQVTEKLAGRSVTVHALSRQGEQSDARANVIHSRCDLSAEEPTFPQFDALSDGLVYLPGTINLKPFY